MNNSTYFNCGKPGCRLALVFSCPGRIEENNKKPVAGQTGNNLATVLDGLHQQLPRIFKYSDRYDYRITNATTKPLFYKRDNRTEGTSAEVLDPINLNRLYNEIKDMEYVISFGHNAKLAVDSCINNQTVFPVHIPCEYHLSSRRINRSISNDENDVPLKKGKKGNLKLRLNVIIKEIRDSF